MGAGRYVAALSFLFAAIAATNVCCADVQSTFSGGAEDWTSVMLAYPQPPSPPVPLGNSPYTPNWGSYGNPAQKGVSLADPDGNAQNGNTQYWSAPPKFLGNQTAAYGGQLSYDLIDTGAGFGSFAQEDAILVGAGLALVYVTPSASWPDGTTNWKHMGLPLTEVGWHRDSPSGAAANASDMHSVLSSLTNVYLRAEYQLGPDVAYVANVNLVYAPQSVSDAPFPLWALVILAAALAGLALRQV